MEEFMVSFRHFWSEWGPFIAVYLIPTIITGLSVSPKTQEAAGWVAKIWGFVKKILAIFSVATFKDEPGTFQVPVANKNLKAMVKKGGKGAVSLLLIGGLILSQSGCCTWTGTCESKAGKIVTEVVNCAKESIKSQAFHLLPAVAAIITGGAPNWKDQLDSLKAMGWEALACALSQVSQELLAMSNPPENFSAGREQLKEIAKAKSDLSKIDEYIKENNTSVK
jgi:hypothetical protein